ncbi:MAG: tail fiber domain-containing protein [Pseudomonadota bacterium]|nr:tail fiber domain-containing protein [Pseudomonadota bacterium]
MRIFRNISSVRHRGFTLVELAIGLAVLGVLFAGVWRLIGGMNQQLQDQAVARQTKAIAEAANRYSQVERPRIVLLAPNQWHIIGVVDDPASPMPELQPAYLSPNTTDTNPLGQRYQVLVQHDNAGNVETFVAATGATIPVDDLRAARIVGMTGADAGTIYSDEPPGAMVIRGAYGGWTRPVSDFGGVIPMAAGDIITGTMFATTDLGAPFLYRDVVAGNPEFNRMNTDIDMNGRSLLNTLSLTGANISTVHPDGTGTPMTLHVFGDINTQSGVFTGCTTNCASGWQAKMEQDGDIVARGTVSGNRGEFMDVVSNTLSVSRADVAQSLFVRASASMRVLGPATLEGQVKIGPNPSDQATAALVVGSRGMESAFFGGNVAIGGDLFVGGTCTRCSGSDINLKKDIRPIANALERLLEIKGVSYVWKKDGKKGLGVIAQDVEKVFPELVVENEGIRYVSYDHLAGPLIEAIRKLKTDSDTLRREVERLKEIRG